MLRKRKYRRLSRKARPRSMSRMYMRRRMRRLRYKTRPEVKIAAFGANCQSNKLAINAAGTSDAALYSAQNFSADILANISQGTNYTERVGNTIFVKGMRIRTLTYGCAETESISISNFLLRIIIWTGTNTIATTVPGFFNVSSRQNFYLPINRKKVNQVLYDRVHYFNSGGYINDASSRNATSGAVKSLNIWIPINRRITYTIDAKVKDENAKFNMAMLVATPGMCESTYNNRQIACTNYAIQVFFTDN